MGFITIETQAAPPVEHAVTRGEMDQATATSSSRPSPPARRGDVEPIGTGKIAREHLRLGHLSKDEGQTGTATAVSKYRVGSKNARECSKTEKRRSGSEVNNVRNPRGAAKPYAW